MRYYCLIFILGCLFGTVMTGCTKPDDSAVEPPKPERYTDEDLQSALALLSNKPDDLSSNHKVWGYYTETSQLEALIAHAEPVFERSYDVPGMERLALTSGAFIAQAYVFRETFDSDSVAYYLTRIMPLVGSEYSNDFLDALTHNVAALYYLKTELDYSTALEHYEAALAIMERKGETTSRSTLLCNIASIYVSLRDTAGFEYAREAYDLNHSEKPGLRAYGRVLSTILLARMHYLKDDFRNALAFADEASEEVAAFPQFMSNLEMLYADIAADRGDYRRAEHYYSRSISHGKDNEPGAYLSYGMMLSRLSRYTEAMDMFNRGLALRTLEHRDDLLLALSDIAVRQGRDKEALELYKEYHACLDSVSYIQRERAFRQNRLLAKDNELQSRELELLKANRRIVFFISGGVLLLVLAIALWVLNRRKNRMYRRLVETHQQSLTRLSGIRELSGSGNIGDGGENGAQERDDRDLQLWRRLESIMLSERIYRYSDISLDRIAEILGTNRVYVSRAINNYAGMSFYHYIHSRRIEDASRILSDVSTDVSLKALAFELGYNSISSFYRAFTKETGVPPSRYREEVLKIKQNPED